MRRFLSLLVAVGVLTASPTRGEDSKTEIIEPEVSWEVETKGGRTFVPLESVAEIYGFDEVKTQGTETVLKSSSAVLKVKIDSKTLEINGMKYGLNLAIQKGRKGKPIISSLDVSGLLDLVFRPRDNMQPRQVQAIYFDSSREPDCEEATEYIRHYLADSGLDIVSGAQSPQPWGISLPSDLPRKQQVVGAAHTIRIFLRGGADKTLKPGETRTVYLAPAGSPAYAAEDESGQSMETIYAGNLYGAESLALGTMFQRFLLVGKGAASATLVPGWATELKKLDQPGIQIFWGAEVEPEAIAKAVAEGAKAYAAFMREESLRKSEQQAALMLPLSIAKTDIRIEASQTAEKAEEGDTKKSKEEELASLHLRLDIKKNPGVSEVIDPSQVELQVFFFDRKADDRVDLVDSPMPEVKWISILPDWTIDGPEVVELSYHVSKEDLDGGGVERSGFGYVVRLVYGEMLMDTVSEPRGLLNQLWRFTPIFP